MRIATLGPPGTYSEQAALIFARRLGIVPSEIKLIYTSILNTLRLVQNREVDYALVPVENMLDGLIGSTFDALLDYQDFVKVADEIRLPLSHVLAALPDSDWSKIETIYSHPSPLNQCLNHLTEFFPQATLLPVESTVVAAQIVKDSSFNNRAAICSRDTAINHNLEIYPHEIQDYASNETRFFACALQDGTPSGNDRTLLAVRYGSNYPGQLYHTTKFFAENNIDLTFVHSRPYKVKPQEYVILFELVGHKSQPEIEAALKKIELQVRTTDGWKKVLGSYPRREREELLNAT